MIKHKAMEPLQIYGYMTLVAQHGHKEVVVVEARLVHCILLTTEAEAGDSWGGPKLDCVPRGGGRQQPGHHGPGVNCGVGVAPGQGGVTGWWPVWGRASRGLAASALELETKVIRRFPKISQSRRRPLQGLSSG